MALTAYSTPMFLCLYDVKSWCFETQIIKLVLHIICHLFVKLGY